MHALLVKVRIEVNSFLFHVKSKHTMSYCVQVSYQVPCGQTLKYFATFLHVSCFAAYCVVPLSLKRSENYWDMKQRCSS